MSEYIFWDEMWNQNEEHRQERLQHPGASSTDQKKHDSEESRPR